jgi:hypothetical protein
MAIAAIGSSRSLRSLKTVTSTSTVPTIPTSAISSISSIRAPPGEGPDATSDCSDKGTPPTSPDGALVLPRVSYIGDYNREAKPFRWTYEGRPLEAA